MNRLFLALVLALAVVTPVLAVKAPFTGCTTDNQAVLLILDVNDALREQHPVLGHISAAFASAASRLTAAELQSQVGFEQFVAGLDSFDINAIDAIVGPPMITGTCK